MFGCFCMKLLLVTNMYPGRNKECMYSGIFVKEQVESLQKFKNIDSDVFIIDGHLGKINYLRSAFKILGMIRRGRYDVVHAHYGLSALFVLLQPFKKWRNVYLTLHGGDILPAQGKWLQVFLTRQIVKRVSGVVVINDEMISIVSNINNSFRLIPCGVDTQFFKRVESDTRSNRILFAGNPKRWVKNYELFERIIARYQELYGAVEVVALDGFDREQIRDLLASSAALVMTSRSEGSPQIIKEALSCDTAIVSADVGDVRSVLGGAPGTVVFNADESIDKIAGLLRDSILAAAASKGARRNRVFEMSLDEESISTKLADYYRECL